MLDKLYDFDNIEFFSESHTDNQIVLSGTLANSNCKCPNCGEIVSQHVHKHEQVKYMDLNIGDMKVTLDLDKTYYRCSACGTCYPAHSEDLDDNRRLTKRLLHYVGLLCTTESYDTVARITGISKGSLGRILLSYMQAEMLSAKNIRTDKILIFEKRIKNNYCICIATLNPTKFLYIMPVSEQNYISNFFDEQYMVAKPKVIYCEPFADIVETVKERFREVMVVVEPNALFNLIKSTIRDLKRKYDVNIKETIVSHTPFSLGNISITPYDERFMLCYEWLNGLLEIMNGNGSLKDVKAHIARGEKLFDSIRWMPYMIFEKYPELLYNYRFYRCADEDLKAYNLLEKAMKNAASSKSLSRAINKLLYADSLQHVHRKKSEAKQNDTDMIPIPIKECRTPYEKVQEIFETEKYAVLDAYHKLELIGIEHKELYNYANDILLESVKAGS